MEQNPIKAKLNSNYFFQKVEKMVTDELDKNSIRARRTPAIIKNLKVFVEEKRIIERSFWGYGIERLSNGTKTVDKIQLQGIGFLLTLFYLHERSIRFHFLTLHYRSGEIHTTLPDFDLPLNLINKVSYSSNSNQGIYYTNISSLYTDKPILIRADEIHKARYYSGEISRLKDEKLGTFIASKSFPLPPKQKQNRWNNITKKLWSSIKSIFSLSPSLGVQLIQLLIAIFLFLLAFGVIQKLK